MKVVPAPKMINSVEKDWEAALTMLGLDDAELLSLSDHDSFRRTYRRGRLVYKIVFTEKEESGERRANTLQQEFRLLRACEGLSGIQKTVEYRSIDNLHILINQYSDGQTLENLRPGFLYFSIILLRLMIVIVRLARLGISHNDLIESNILVSYNLRVTLLDFDQATRVPAKIALLRGLFGVGQDGGECVAYGSLLMLLKNFAKSNFPGWLQKIVRIPFRVVRSIYRNNRYRQEHKLPVLEDASNASTKRMLLAWKIAQKSNASSPGKIRAYYSLDYNGYKFPGERKWEERWEALSNITDYSDRKILELGCNMGLLSCFLFREAKASKVLGVDRDPEILQSARLVAEAFKVKADFRQVDFDSSSVWERELADYRPDIVFALNVLNWVGDKERLLRFLGQFREVIFEGHDSFEVESERLQSVGFTQVRRIVTTERQRDVLHCTR